MWFKFNRESLASLNKEDLKKCDSYKELASLIMIARQGNKSMGDLLEIAVDDNDKLSIELIKEAYGYPKFSLIQFKIDSIKSFGEDAYFECINILSK